MSAKIVKFHEPFERLTNVDECRVIQVVEIKSLVGEGDNTGTPSRQITEYFSLDGKRLARIDRYLDDSLHALGVWNNNRDADEKPAPIERRKK